MPKGEKLQTLTSNLASSTDTTWTDVTGIDGVGDTRGIHTSELQFVELTDEVNSQLTYYGRSAEVDAGSRTDEEIFQIWRTRKTGTETILEYASDSSAFSFAWDDRTTYFSTPVISNPASLLFDGVDEFITLGDNYTFGPATAFSWSFWMKANNFAAQRAMIAKTSQDANVYGYSIQHNSSGRLFLQVRAPTTLRTHTGTTVLSSGTWYHICVTYAGGSNMNGFRLYINGSVEPTPASASLAAWTVTDPLTFGNRGNTFHYSGNLNQITVWNDALSSAEVTELYNSGSPGDPQASSMSANFLSWWSLAKASNFPTEVDLEGSVNGTLTNMEVGDYDDLDVP